jgi:NodT family efflux transporter outer membrane factor (OMF) lipoprotein
MTRTEFDTDKAARLRSMRLGRVLLVLPAALLLACASQTREVRPPFEVPAQFSVSGTEVLPDKWWRSFEDHELDSLMDQALTGNLSLKGAWDRLVQAQAVARQAGADLYPTVDMEAGASRLTIREDGATEHRNSLSLGLVAGYELDLWGRIRAGRDAAELDLRASREDLTTAALTLTAQVASVWYRLAEQYGQKRLLDEQTDTNEQVLKVVTLRFRRGQAGAADVLRQRQLVESKRGETYQVEAAIKVLEHQLAVLLGQPPTQPVAEPTAGVKELRPLPQAGLPADLIQRRPDVLSAYYGVFAADRRVAAAIADRFPRISLGAEVSSSGQHSGDLFHNWINTLAVNLIGPVVDGGWREQEVARTRAAASEKLRAYGQTVLDALKEVEDALALEKRQHKYIRSLDKQLELSGQAVERVRDRYTKGAEDYLRFLDALLTHQQLQRARLSAGLEIIQDRIDLCRALGGGWQLTAPGQDP